KVRALGVTSAERWQSLADIPAIAETVPGYEALIWYAIMAPKGTPPGVVFALNQAVNAALGDRALVARLAETGGVPMAMTPQALGRFIDEDVARWRKVVDIAGITAE